MLTAQITSCSRNSHSSQGYSLTELAIVLVIIGLVAGMTLSLGKMQMDIAESEGTRERLQLIHDALSLFQKKNKRYPCPALPAASAADATYGLEVSGGCTSACPAGLNCSNSAVIGVVPFKALRLNEEVAYDSWGNRIAYAIDKNHTEASTFNTGGIPIKDINGNEITSSPLLGDAIFVLVSHGSDSKGAYNKSGAVATACGTTGEDVENCNGDDIFVDNRFIPSDNAASYYDDLVIWKTQENVKTEEEVGPILSISGGWDHTCTVKKSDGTVWCWGEGQFGRLGIGNENDTTTPTMAVNGLTDATQVDCGWNFTCALKSDGTVWCWGDNQDGQLGNGNLIDQFTPVQVSGMTSATQIAIGNEHGCALKSDDTVWCWGDNDHGELGDGYTTDNWTPEQVTGLTDVMAIGAGWSTCALKSDGTTWCWGNASNGALGNNTTAPDQLIPVHVPGFTDGVEVVVTELTAYARKADGTMWSWGRGMYGKHGDGTNNDSLTPQQVPGMSGVEQISAQNDHVCVRRTDSTVWCWGKNNFLQIDDSGPHKNVPTQITGLSGVELIGTGWNHTCALKSDGAVWCWGKGDRGEMGDGDTDNEFPPIQIPNFP
jgi:prepilin-type N-terminal cleavage/methylation domain-containing protein